MARKRRSAFGKQAAQLIAESGLEPHEWLYALALGQPLEQVVIETEYDDEGRAVGTITKSVDYYLQPSARVECAKIAAPYYAPRLNNTSLGTDKESLEDVLAACEEIGQVLRA